MLILFDSCGAAKNSPTPAWVSEDGRAPHALLTTLIHFFKAEKLVSFYRRASVHFSSKHFYFDMPCYSASCAEESVPGLSPSRFLSVSARLCLQSADTSVHILHQIKGQSRKTDSMVTGRDEKTERRRKIEALPVEQYTTF